MSSSSSTTTAATDSASAILPTPSSSTVATTPPAGCATKFSEQIEDKTLSDEFRIYTCSWLPAEPAIAVLFIVHGIHEHCGRYVKVGEFFASQRIACYSCDLPGHGKSTGERGHWQEISVVTGTIEALVRKRSALHPGLPVFILGHSAGALMSFATLPKISEVLTGALFSGMPAPRPAAPFVAGVTVVAKVSPLAGAVGLDKNGLASDPHVLEAYGKDPLVYLGKMRARTALIMSRASEQNFEFARSGLALPVAFWHGEDDTICPMAEAEVLFHCIGGRCIDKAFRPCKEVRHEILNDYSREVVMTEMNKWIQSHAIEALYAPCIVEVVPQQK